MDVANASLLDEATAAAEGMALAHRVCPRKDARVFLADRTAFPQTLELLAARAEPLGLELRIVDVETAEIRPGRLRRAAADAGHQRPGPRPDGHHRARPRRQVARRRRQRPPRVRADHATGRDGRRRRRRQRPALRRPARLRWPARGVLRHPRRLRPPDARTPHRRLGRRAGQDRLSHGDPDARAAHPPREGDVEHLHRAGSARQHRRVLRRAPRARGPGHHRAARPRPGGRARGAARPARRRAAQRRLLRHAVHRCRPSRRGGAYPPGGGSRASQLPLRPHPRRDRARRNGRSVRPRRDRPGVPHVGPVVHR